MKHLHAARELLRKNQAVVLATITQVQGSGPREVGAWMLISTSEVVNTIGGGHFEFEVIAHARSMKLASESLRFALGPSLGQCCGGVVHVALKRMTAQDWSNLEPTLLQDLPAIALFGGGHVGRAIVNLLGTLPCAVQWIDSRDEIFPQEIPLNVQTEHSAPVHAAVNDLPVSSHVLVMSFSHAEDLDIVATCLQRMRDKQDLGFIGLIGSKTKWATFKHRLLERGFSEKELDRINCPIGINGITGKQPEVIAVAVVAQLLGAIS
jgi:xanthine dehydrogenase accessory factor